jgi:hypothetical protein
MTEEHDHHDHEAPDRTFLWWVWNIFFTVMYPVLATFSLLFTGLLVLFSFISRILFKVLDSFSAENKSAKKTEQTVSEVI